MTRLYEEVLTRLEEMAMITARTLRTGSNAGSVVKFNPVGSDTQVDFAAVEIVSTPNGHGCYDYRRGACFESTSRQLDLERKNEET